MSARWVTLLRDETASIRVATPPALVILDSERAVHWLPDGGAEMGTVTPEDLGDVIGPIAERLLR